MPGLVQCRAEHSVRGTQRGRHQHSNPSLREDPEVSVSSLPCTVYVHRNPHPDEAVYHFILFSHLLASQHCGE